MEAMSIWHWLIVLGVFATVVHAAMPGLLGAAAKDALHDLERVTSLPLWLAVTIAAVAVLCVLAIAKRLTGR